MHRNILDYMHLHDSNKKYLLKFVVEDPPASALAWDPAVSDVSAPTASDIPLGPETTPGTTSVVVCISISIV
jgi:hypothetical protein